MMEIRREKTAEHNGENSIRLSYSRQFQHGGQTHTIDAETTLAVGVDPERREQVIRALEAGVEQLARQIIQRGTRPAAPVPPGIPVGRTPEPARKGETTTAPLPVSESMPATPPASGGRTISLPYFIDYIKKRWNMSPKEAMDLLDVRELTGLNYREALYKLRAIKEPQNSPASAPAPSSPAGETPRQSESRSSHIQAGSPASVAAGPGTGGGPVTGLAAPRYENRTPSPRPSSIVSTASTTPPATLSGTHPDEDTIVSEREALPDFAGSPKAPLPIQLGVVRDATTPNYRFEEEEEEEEYDLPDDSDMLRQSAQFKLEELREVRGNSVVSNERLSALNNVIGEQISADQMEKLIRVIWSVPNRKRLKAQQVEALISWAKEDLFVEEAEAILQLLAEGEV